MERGRNLTKERELECEGANMTLAILFHPGKLVFVCFTLAIWFVPPRQSGDSFWAGDQNQQDTANHMWPKPGSSHLCWRQGWQHGWRQGCSLLKKDPSSGCKRQSLASSCSFWNTHRCFPFNPDYPPSRVQTHQEGKEIDLIDKYTMNVYGREENSNCGAIWFVGGQSDNRFK